MNTFRAEFHIHTVLSACADVEMIPPLIIQTAQEKGIDLIAITDHNASANVEPVMKAAKGSGIKVLAGMELQTKEEVHIICLFDHLDQLIAFQDLIDEHLPEMQNDPEHFGEQYIVDETGNFVNRETRLLSTSVDITLKNAWLKVNSLGGLMIPAHVNRDAFGLMPVLGFIPPDIKPDALEISKHISIEEAKHKYPQLEDFTIIQSGDAHFLEDILGKNILIIENRSIEEIRKALHDIDGRSTKII